MSRDKKALRILFLGTPEFAKFALKALVEAGHIIVAAVTVADKPKGRGQTMSASPVKVYAESLGIEVLQPVNLKSQEFIDQLSAVKPDLGVVVAFRMLPEQVWALPELGTVNVHASLLPQYRGAAPINHAIINGETETGVTIFKLKQEIDTGDVLLNRTLQIGADETAGELHDRLMHCGAEALVEAIARLENGQTRAVSQTMMLAGETELKLAPKIFREDCRIRWDWPSLRIHHFIRGLSPRPGAWTELEGKTVKIIRGTARKLAESGEAGTILISENKSINVVTGDGYYAIIQLQPEGKKTMTAEEFLRGNRLTVNARFV